MSGPEKEEQKDAIYEEIKSLVENETWELVNRPSEGNIVGTKTILTNKYNAQGQIERRKARIVAKGFSQRPGRDYHETFAPVARLSSLRLIISIAARCNLKIYQGDFTTAYLNGKLEEEVIMELPDNLEEMLRKIQCQ